MSAEDKNDKEKLILRNEEYQGVILSDYDFTLMSTVPGAITTVTKSMWKVKGITYLGVKQFANEVGDVIQVGKLGKLYRIVAFVRREGTLMGGGGDIIRVKRADQNLTTNVDLDNAVEGAKIRIIGRRSFQKRLDHPLGRDEED